MQIPEELAQEWAMANGWMDLQHVPGSAPRDGGEWFGYSGPLDFCPLPLPKEFKLWATGKMLCNSVGAATANLANVTIEPDARGGVFSIMEHGRYPADSYGVRHHADVPNAYREAIPQEPLDIINWKLSDRVRPKQTEAATSGQYIFRAEHDHNPAWEMDRYSAQSYSHFDRDDYYDHLVGSAIRDLSLCKGSKAVFYSENNSENYSRGYPVLEMQSLVIFAVSCVELAEVGDIFYSNLRFEVPRGRPINMFCPNQRRKPIPSFRRPTDPVRTTFREIRVETVEIGYGRFLANYYRRIG